ncbi:hypothetical protein N657DRAFT_642183 [Parathielavia appendiculata]|uniref:Uncharacterized protein n=1 Tax=Parathielavia appendiculata TaxID=2587402 RepID=A0AAN6U2V2_9PEZI|nr:hypothetical protein N657DRAFT_642183 [Parathielavia appendiculata]
MPELPYQSLSPHHHHRYLCTQSLPHCDLSPGFPVMRPSRPLHVFPERPTSQPAILKNHDDPPQETRSDDAKGSSI